MNELASETQGRRLLDRNLTRQKANTRLPPYVAYDSSGEHETLVLTLGRSSDLLRVSIDQSKLRSELKSMRFNARIFEESKH